MPILPILYIPVKGRVWAAPFSLASMPILPILYLPANSPLPASARERPRLSPTPARRW